MADRLMTAEEALGRLTSACGDHAAGDSACWEVEALKRAGWKASMIVGQPPGGFTVVMTPPATAKTRCTKCGCTDGMHYEWCKG